MNQVEIRIPPLADSCPIIITDFVRQKKTLFFILLFLPFIFRCSNDHQKWKYQPFSKGVIQFEFMNQPPSTYYIYAEGRTMIPSGWFDTDILKINDAGNYLIDFEIDRPATILTHIAENDYPIFVFPGDTSKVQLDFNQNEYTLEFVGNTRNINNYLAQKAVNKKNLNIELQGEILYYRNIEYNDFITAIDSMVKAEWDYLEKRKSLFHLPSKYVSYEKARIYYAGLRYKLDKGHNQGEYDRIGRFIKNDRPPPAEYMELLVEPEISNSTAIFTQSYLDYLHTFILYKNHEAETVSFYTVLYLTPTLDDFDFGLSILSGKTREVYKLNTFSKLTQSVRDSLKIDSLAKNYDINDYKQYIRSNHDKLPKNLPKETLVPGFYMSDNKYSLVSIRDFIDDNLIIRFCNQIPDSASIDNLIFEKLQANYLHYKDIRFINIYMNIAPNEWLEKMNLFDLGENNYLIEGQWPAELTKKFDIKKLPYYIFIGKGNIFIDKHEQISLLLQDEIDSLFVDDQKQAIL